MTTEFREIISHKSEICDGIRMLMAIVPAADNKEGCIAIKLQWQIGINEWDGDTELVAYLSCADIAKLLLVFDGYKTGVFELESGIDTRVSFRRRGLDGLYKLKIYSGDSTRHIILPMHEAVMVREILRTAIFRIVFG